MNSEISICIVNWNTQSYLDRCLRSIEKTRASLRCEVIVVDNASTDGSQVWVRHHFPYVHLIENKLNMGFASANNQAFEKAEGKWILMLNPDTELLPDSLQNLLECLKKNAQVAIAAPKLLNSDGSLQRSVRRFPNFKTVLYRHTFLKKLGIFSKDEAHNKMSDFSFDHERSVDQPAGAALLIRREVLDAVGGLDSTFFLFYEEVDLCLRIKRRGYEINYCPQAQMIHHEGKSRQKNRQYLFMPTLHSMFYYFDKHFGEKQTQAFRWLFKPLFVVSTFWDVIEEGLSFVVYWFKKDAYRAQRKKEKCQLKAHFLKNDLAEFLFKI